MEVPYGQIMLSILLQNDLIPEIVIEEESAEAEHHRNLFQERLGAKSLAPTIASLVEKYGLKYAKVDNLCGYECENIIKQEKPDVIALGGTRRLIRKNIFTIPPWGTLCSHPGLLPYVRGAASPAWSILYDIKVGCSCFIIDEDLDTGPVLRSKIVPVYQDDTYADVVRRNISSCGDLMAEVLKMFKKRGGPIKGQPQDLSRGETYRTMEAELVEQVKQKLQEGSYRWLEPRPS